MSLNWVTWRRKLNAVLIPSNGKRQEPLTRHEGGRTDATPRLLVVRPPWPSSSGWPASTDSRRVAGITSDSHRRFKSILASYAIASISRIWHSFEMCVRHDWFTEQSAWLGSISPIMRIRYFVSCSQKVE